MRDTMAQEEAMNMSNEQAVQILIPMRNMMCVQNGRPISDAVFAIDLAISALQDDWIPVSERLPEVGDTYIVSGRMKYDFEKEYTYFTDCAEYLPIGSTDGTEWETWTDWYEGQQEYEILAWQPLPEPYKESEE